MRELMDAEGGKIGLDEVVRSEEEYRSGRMGISGRLMMRFEAWRAARVGNMVVSWCRGIEVVVEVD